MWLQLQEEGGKGHRRMEGDCPSQRGSGYKAPGDEGQRGLKLTPGQRLFMLPFHPLDCLKCLEEDVFMG